MAPGDRSILWAGPEQNISNGAIGIGHTHGRGQLIPRACLRSHGPTVNNTEAEREKYKATTGGVGSRHKAAFPRQVLRPFLIRNAKTGERSIAVQHRSAQGRTVPRVCPTQTACACKDAFAMNAEAPGRVRGLRASFWSLAFGEFCA